MKSQREIEFNFHWSAHLLDFDEEDRTEPDG